jgi:hypothetical protein
MNMYNDTSITPFPIPLNGQDIYYGLASYSPGKAKLKTLKYNGIDTGIANSELEFRPWFVADTFSAGDIRIGAVTAFTGEISSQSPRTDTIPMIIHGISVGA